MFLDNLGLNNIFFL